MFDEKPGLQELQRRMLQLRAMPGFAMLDMDTLELLAESSRLRRFRKGDVVLRAGAPVERVYMTIEGGIEARRGSRRVDAQAFGGVGFLSLLAGDKAGVDAVATADVRVLEVPADTALRVMTESFAITRLAIRSLSRQLLDVWGALPPAESSPSAVDVGTRRDRPLTLVERLLMLRRTPLGRYANMDASSEMARAMTEVHVVAGATLWTRGEPSTFWLGIEHGCVRLDGEGDHVGWTGARRVLGVLESWADTPRPYTATAETDLVVHRVEIASMLAVAETHTAMGVQLSRYLARDLVAADDEDRGLRGYRSRRPAPPRDG